MEFINRLPVVLSALMTIIIGLISFKGNDNLESTYIKMAVSIVAFYAIGVFIRNTFLEIETDIKEKQKERWDEEEKLKTAVNETVDLEEKGTGKEPEAGPQKIDYRVDD